MSILKCSSTTYIMMLEPQFLTSSEWKFLEILDIPDDPKYLWVKYNTWNRKKLYCHPSPLAGKIRYLLSIFYFAVLKRIFVAKIQKSGCWQKKSWYFCQGCLFIFQPTPSNFLFLRLQLNFHYTKLLKFTLEFARITFLFGNGLHSRVGSRNHKAYFTFFFG